MAADATAEARLPAVTRPAGRRAAAVRHRTEPLLVVLGLAVLWEILTRTDVLPSRYIPPVTVIVPELADLLTTGTFWSSFGATVYSWALGFVIATAIGVPLGLLIGSSRLLHRATSVVIEFLRPIPSVALIPLVVLVLGAGYQATLMLVVFACVWPQLVQASYGAQAVDRVGWETAVSFRLSAWQRFRRITVPSASPYLLTGCRIASSIDLIIVVTAGIVIRTPGLGNEITLAANAGSFDSMYAYILVTGIVGYAFTTGIAAVEKRLMSWRPEFRKAH
ncbi:Bicarbonate transport system permease protein CmpB [Streptomyces sp. RB5]|uniref:Bicarbonate transport system permease protein CmpB n=1 Tax=Streptomyces smaragdinus TaxID=2585196 RepID=A0A7K0CFG4_9ACTN|nr:ABC transporter permease [Streptomyces smaragdinus]MQY11762.1 Bicarbonate transport system permease protein CmpB [Streptomyces smaragdinus]